MSTVDVAIPGDTKADLMLKSGHRSIMASPDLKIDVNKGVEKGVDENYSSVVNGKLNSGGMQFILMSQYGKIYLRKAK